MKYINFFIIFFFLNQSQAAHYIQSWNKMKMRDNDELNEILKKNNCTPLKKQMIFFKEKNRIVTLTFPNQGLVQNCLVKKRFSDNELGIVSWGSHIVKKDENLSSLIRNSGCSEIFTKQIPEFEKRNNIRNGDIISVGQEIQIQSCKEDVTKKMVVVKEEIKEEIKEEVNKTHFYNTISIGFNSSIFSMIDYKHEKVIFKLASSEQNLLLDLSFVITNTKNLDFFTGISFEDFNKKSLNLGLSLNLEKANYKISYSHKKLMTNFHYKIWKESGVYFHTRYGENSQSFFPGFFFTF